MDRAGKNTWAGIPFVRATLAVSVLNVLALLTIFLPDDSLSCIFAFILIIIIDTFWLFQSAKKFSSILRELNKLQNEFAESVQEIQKLSDAGSTGVSDSPSSAGLREQVKRLSLLLSESRKKERSAIDKAVDVICVLDTDSRFVSLNPSVEKAWGYKAEELLGEAVSKILVDEQKEKSLAELIGARQSIDKTTFENRARCKDGRIIDLSWSAHWSVNDQGLFCIVRDISERKLAEERLRESEDGLRTTLESMPVGVLCTATNGVIEYANPAIERLSGKSAQELLGTSFTDHLRGEDRKALSKYLSTLGEEESEDKPAEAQIPGKDGSLTPLEISAKSFSLRGTAKYLIIASDISARKEQERLRQEFSAMINHDLRSPLTSIAGLIGLLQEGLYGELVSKGKQVCEIALSEINRMMSLINNLLDLDKLQAGKLRVYRQNVPAGEIISATVNSMDLFAKTRGVNLEAPDCRLECFGDRERLIQVLVNLLSNAIKFSPKDSSIRIQVSEEPQSLKFSVIDHGRGIPENKQEKLFERFEQVRPDDAVEKSGTGLGLSICKAIIEAHEGQIGCLSKENEGSTFWFTVPKPPESIAES